MCNNSITLRVSSAGVIYPCQPAAIGNAMTASALRERQKPESFRFTLRAATRAAHAALDAHPALSTLMDGTLSPEGYRQLMSFFYAFYNRHDDMLGMACCRYEMERHGFVKAMFIRNVNMMRATEH